MNKKCPNCLHDVGGKWYCDGETASELRIIAAMRGAEQSAAITEIHYRMRWDGSGHGERDQ